MSASPAATGPADHQNNKAVVSDITVLLTEQIGKVMALCRQQLSCYLAPGTSAHRVWQQTRQAAVRLTFYAEPFLNLLGLSATTSQRQRLQPIDWLWLYGRSVAVVLSVLVAVWFLFNWVLDSVTQLLVPSYAVFSLFYWQNSWFKADWSTSSCQIVFATVFISDLLLSIFASHWRSYFSQLLLSFSLPLVAILVAPHLTGSTGKCPDRSSLYLLATLFFTRIAARKSFSLLPLSWRQFFAYSLGFCGISASTATATSPPDQPKPVEKLVITAPEKPAKKEFQFGPDRSQPEPSTTTAKPPVQSCRGRRTSLPAGSLLPGKISTSVSVSFP